MFEQSSLIAARIRKRRQAIGISREKLAQLINTDIEHIKAIEEGAIEFKGREHALAGVLMCHPRWLLTGRGSPDLTDPNTNSASRRRARLIEQICGITENKDALSAGNA